MRDDSKWRLVDEYGTGQYHVKTFVMELPGGLLVRTATFYMSQNVEALVFVPGLKLDGENRIVAASALELLPVVGISRAP